MKKALLLIVGLGVCWLLGACADEPRTETGTDGLQRDAAVQIVSEYNIDSAQVFFLRKTAVSDSLIFKQMIYGIGTTPARFDFKLPAGSYAMYIFGNLPTEKLVMQPPYSAENIGYSYQGGEQPPVAYYGFGNINIGVDTLQLSGLILLVSEVVFTIKEVPAGIGRIEVEFLNTSSGTGLAGYFTEPMSPPLHETVENIQAGNTYTVSTHCFPPRKDGEKSSVNVLCYSNLGKLVYSGESSPFTLKAGTRMHIACSFDSSPLAGRRTSGQFGETTLKWEYAETDF